MNNVTNDNNNDAILRLLESKKNIIKKSETQGFQDGIQWAEQKAEYEQLNSLFNYCNKVCVEFDIDYNDFIYETCSKFNYDTNIFPVNASMYDYLYLLNFINGALEIFAQVEKIK